MHINRSCNTGYMRAVRLTLQFILLVFAPVVFAQEFTSSSFRISAPVIAVPGGYGTSLSFQLYGALTQPAIGTSTITDFSDNSGFLYYPFVNVPVVTATAGDKQVTLSWTASAGVLGWNVSGYNDGRSTTSGSGYAYTEVGNVLTATITGLSNGTTYFFVVRAEDAFGNSIATSSEVSSTPTSGGGGGGGGGNGNGPPKPSPQPLFERLIRFITGERAPSAACMKRSDLNCDNHINLKDLSILFSKPQAITGKALSLLFANWTDPLPISVSEPVSGRGSRAVSPLRAFAQVTSIPAPEAPAPAAPGASHQARYSLMLGTIFALLVMFVSYIVLRLFGH